VFDRANLENPVRDWNFVFVPYCTGDVHAGTRTNVLVEGIDGPQQFVGRLNMEAFLQRLVPTFPNVERVLLTGESAGGFGSAANALLVQRAFDTVPVHLIDDSGPPMSGAYLAPCLQQKWRDTWGLAASMLADCGAHCPDPDDFVFDFALYVARVYADRSSGLIETIHDEIIAGFFGAGLNGCTGIPLITPLPADQFEQGLLELRESLRDEPNFGTYYLPGTTHTWIGSDRFYTASVGDASLRDWFADVVQDRGAGVVGPTSEPTDLASGASEPPAQN
jgi:hypothetical protein